MPEARVNSPAIVDEDASGDPDPAAAPVDFTEFPSFPLTFIQFDPSDQFYYLQPCLGAPVYHTEVILDPSNSTLFEVGEPINVVGGIGTPTAKVLGYRIEDGVATLSYALDNPGPDFSDPQVLKGTTSGAQGTVSGTPQPSDFLKELDGTSLGFPGGGEPGFDFPDLSNKPDTAGFQYSCDVQRIIKIPSEDDYQPIDVLYFQGDWGARRN
jgi:hypothetical protein